MQITANLKERMMLQGLLPTEGSYIDNIVSRDLNAKLELSQQELDDYEVGPLPGGQLIGWNAKGEASQKVIELTEREEAMLELSLNMAEGNRKLPMQLVRMYEVICKVSSSPSTTSAS